MAISALTFAAPVKRRGQEQNLDYEVLESAIASFDAGDHAASLTQVFAHLFPKHDTANIATSGFSFNQGSSKVAVKIDGEHLVVSVPLVRLPSTGMSVAAMRYLLTKISGSGQLHQPRLRGEDVYLEFRDRLNRLHPYKLVEVLKRMPVEADSNDDWLIGQFQALPLEREEMQPLTAAEADAAEAMWRQHWNDIDELIKESQRKRSVFFLNELTAYAFYRVRFALPVTGFLFSKLAEHARLFNNGDEDPTKRENSLVKCINEMKAISSADLRRDLGHPTYAISPNSEGTPAVLNGYFSSGNYMEQIEQYRTTGKSMEAALALVSTYTFLLGRYSWPQEIEEDLLAGLGKASGKPWREAASLLFAHSKELQEKFGDDGDSDDDDEDDVDDDDESGDDSLENQGSN